jgi:hypothetical protein
MPRIDSYRSASVALRQNLVAISRARAHAASVLTVGTGSSIDLFRKWPLAGGAYAIGKLVEGFVM